MHSSSSSQHSVFPVSTGARLQPLERSVIGTIGVALMIFGLRGSTLHKLTLGSAGLGLATLATTGSNPLATALKIRQDAAGETLVSDAVTIGKPADELFALWRQLDSLPKYMSHLKRVEVLDDKKSRWTVDSPLGEVSWEAELTADEPGRKIAWTSLPGAAVSNSGEVLFRPAPGERGTEVVVHFKYDAPGGSSGAVIARMLGQEPSQQLRDDLTRFKREQEYGSAPTTDGQSSGRAKAGKGGSK
jgi:uncharacterized membrane protein